MKRIIPCLLLGISFKLCANGFFIPQQNVTNLGMAYAGTGAWAIDASTAFYNPAGLTRLWTEQFIIGAVYANSNTFINIDNATATYGQAATPAAGRDKPDATAIIPSMHYAKPITKDFALGASLVSTFGSKNSYEENAVSRYMATESEMKTIDFAPGFGYKWNEHLSIGAGLDLYWGKVTLNSAFTTQNPGTVATDGFSKNQGKGTQVGVHGGLLYEVDDYTRFGMKYSSRVLINFKGETSLQINSTAGVTGQDISAKIDLPESVTFSGYHDLNNVWAVMADLQWFHWSRLRDVELKRANGTSTIFNYHYRNSYRVAAGANYRYDDRMQLRFGISHDTTPTKEPWRTTTVPDGNQTAIAFGIKHSLTDNIALDAGYAHIFSSRVGIHARAGTDVNINPVSANSINATGNSHLNAVGLQLTFNI